MLADWVSYPSDSLLLEMGFLHIAPSPNLSHRERSKERGKPNEEAGGYGKRLEWES